MILSTEALTAIRRPGSGAGKEKEASKPLVSPQANREGLGEASSHNLTLREEGLSEGKLISKPRVKSQGVLPFFCSCSWPVPLWASAIHSRWAPGTPANDQELRTGIEQERTDTRGHPQGLQAFARVIS